MPPRHCRPMLAQAQLWTGAIVLGLGLGSGSTLAQAPINPNPPNPPDRPNSSIPQSVPTPPPAPTATETAPSPSHSAPVPPSPVPQPPLLPEATPQARAAQAQEQNDRSAPGRYDLRRYPLTASQESHWRQTLWATALREPDHPETIAALVALLDLTDQPLDAAQQRLVEMGLQVSHQLYSHAPATYAALTAPLRDTVTHSRDPQWVALALSALALGELDPDDRQNLIADIKRRFPQWVQILPLNLTLQDLVVADLPVETPPLADLLHWQSVAGEPQLYVLCRPDRGVLCSAVLKNGQGQFHREGDKLWSVLLSGRSLHGLPWQFRRGETPQGLFRMEGTVPQPDTEYFRAFGFFDLVNLYVPFEAGVTAFVPPTLGTLDSLSAYQTLLPPQWRAYRPIQQSYWAGKQGRNLFRIHGTGEDPSFFRNNQHYPASQGWNPAIGCLSAQESYDATGQLITGGMPPLLTALTQVGGSEFSGYVTVVEVGANEVPNVDQAIQISQIDQVLRRSNVK
ncbi:MAG: hypothetical protein ACO4CG_01735 [Prochlorothrix sp.]